VEASRNKKTQERGGQPKWAKIPSSKRVGGHGKKDKARTRGDTKNGSTIEQRKKPKKKKKNRRRGGLTRQLTTVNKQRDKTKDNNKKRTKY